MISLTRPRFGSWLAVALVVGIVLRVAWPLADPPEGMSWSNGTYTDPPSNVLAARYAVQGGRGLAIEVPERLLYPALHGLAWIGYEILGPRRLATVVLAALLGTATVGLMGWGLRRGPGPLAGICGAGLAATSAWLVPNARILMAESVAAFGVLGAACVALSSRGVAAPAAGAIAAAAGLFGKYHALAFLPALWIFLARRSGKGALGGAVAGALAVAGAWFAALFAPHHREILQWIGGSSVGLAEATRSTLLSPDVVLAPFTGLQQSWMSLRMPIVGAVGAWFVFRTLGARDEWKRRIDDGSALFALWVATSFLATAILPYRAPRYFTLVATPLVACAACQIALWLAPPTGRPARRPIGWVPLLLWSWGIAFVVQDGIVRVEAWIRQRFFLDEWLHDPHAPTTFSYLYDRIGNLGQQVGVSFGAALLVLGVLRLRGALADDAVPSAATMRRRGAALLALALALDGVSWGSWAIGKTTTIEDGKRSLASVVSRDAVILGGFAPLFTEGTPLVAVPMFGVFRASVLAKEPRPTHLLLVASDYARLGEVLPDLTARLKPVARWPLRTTWVKSIVLYRLPAPEIPESYRPSLFEQAVDALDTPDPDRAFQLAEEHRRVHGESADVALLEATCRAATTDLEGAERLFHRAAELRPQDTMPLRSLGGLAVARSDTAAARAYWMKALALDPGDPDIPNLLWTYLEKN